jgi:hypothetical protein
MQARLQDVLEVLTEQFARAVLSEYLLIEDVRAVLNSNNWLRAVLFAFGFRKEGEVKDTSYGGECRFVGAYPVLLKESVGCVNAGSAALLNQEIKNE